ncbi:SRPBCC family protein [Vitiosangium sp. GDMCC 1.1324]|uniref:SRPBCC family protein n=1 Tax=Vitiosangium sp. (strain GDMCC 1.1324) TaxID=2138576 RepID=UPI00130ED065|nr:SRPBCC family protein [Vitiosangium sp. GDMCC 1.1324]
MTATALDPTTLPLKTSAPDDLARQFSQSFPTTLVPELLWAEFTRALLDSKNAVLWSNDVSTIRTLQPPPLAVGSVLAVTMLGRGAVVHYRVKRFEPPHLLEYASLQGHILAGGATVSVERSMGGSTLCWQGEYRGTEANLGHLDRYLVAFFGQLATRLRKLEAIAPTVS